MLVAGRTIGGVGVGIWPSELPCTSARYLRPTYVVLSWYSKRCRSLLVASDILIKTFLALLLTESSHHKLLDHLWHAEYGWRMGLSPSIRSSNGSRPFSRHAYSYISLFTSVAGDARSTRGLDTCAMQTQAPPRGRFTHSDGVQGYCCRGSSRARSA